MTLCPYLWSPNLYKDILDIYSDRKRRANRRSRMEGLDKAMKAGFKVAPSAVPKQKVTRCPRPSSLNEWKIDQRGPLSHT